MNVDVVLANNFHHGSHEPLHPGARQLDSPRLPAVLK